MLDTRFDGFGESPIAHVPYSPGGGLGSPVPDAMPVLRPDLMREYVAKARGYGGAAVPRALPPSIDDVTRERGPRHYEWMMTDPVVFASVQALKLAILAGGMDLEATVKAKPGAKATTPEEDQAKEMVEFCWRCVERCRGWHAAVKGLLDAAAFGHKLAEKVYEVVVDGPDVGKLAWKAIKVKPRDAWQFVVDNAMNVQGILFRDATGLRHILPREKVAILTWDPTDGDPRGTSILRAAVDPCNLKRLMFPQLYKHACQFGSASLVGKTAPGEVDRYPVGDDGLPVAGVPMVSPQQFMAGQLVHFQNGSVIVVPSGAEVVPIQPQGDGRVFHKAVELFNQEIVNAILLQTRATREAQHGSKADSQTGQDIFGLLVAYGREALSETLRDDLFRQLIALNFGDDAAHQFTPLVTFGETEAQDQPAKWSSASGLKSSGYLGDSQLAELDAMLGLPIRDSEADSQAAVDAQVAAGLPRPGDNPPGDATPQPGDATPQPGDATANPNEIGAKP